MSVERPSTTESSSVVLVGRPGQRIFLFVLSLICLALGWFLFVDNRPIGIVDLGLIVLFSVFPAVFLINDAQMEIRISPLKLESRHFFFFWRLTEFSQDAYWKKTRGGRVEIWEPGCDRRKYLFYPRFNYRVTISQGLEVLIPGIGDRSDTSDTS